MYGLYTHENVDIYGRPLSLIIVPFILGSENMLMSTRFEGGRRSEKVHVMYTCENFTFLDGPLNQQEIYAIGGACCTSIEFGAKWPPFSLTNKMVVGWGKGGVKCLQLSLFSILIKKSLCNITFYSW